MVEGWQTGVCNAVYSSPVSLCVRLARFCGDDEARLDARLMELNFGRWEMQRWENLSGPQLLAWYGQWIDTPTEGGESFMDQYRRVTAFLDELRRLSYRQVAVFTHGGVIACARIYTGEITFEQVFTTMLPYGSVKKIVI